MYTISATARLFIYYRYIFKLFLQAINELCTSQGLPIEILEGHVASVSVSIPWSAPLSDDSFVDVSGLVVTIRPKARIDHGMKCH